MTNNKSWQCPYCGSIQVLSGGNCKVGEIIDQFVESHEFGKVGLRVASIACLNGNCGKLTLRVTLKKVEHGIGISRYFTSETIKEWQLLPASNAKPQPDYIPRHIHQDYTEACQIAHLSPKASATLARRCLHEIIKDFCKISDHNLANAIDKLKAQVEENKAPHGLTIDTIEIIDGIRKMGNIGAHMKLKDDMVVEIDPNEADLLIELIETLFKDLYVTRYEQQARVKKLKNSIAEKITPKQPVAENDDKNNSLTATNQE